MKTRHGDYLALVSAWDGEWDVFVLDVKAGLLGVTHAATLGGAAPAARDFLSQRFTEPADRFQVRVVRSAGPPRHR